jgi:sortase (surface protein transpeptidase)
MKLFKHWKVLVLAIVLGGGLGIGANYIANRDEVKTADAVEPISMGVPRAATVETTDASKAQNNPPKLVKPKMRTESQEKKEEAASSTSQSSKETQKPPTSSTTTPQASTTPSSTSKKKEKTAPSSTVPVTDESEKAADAEVKSDTITVGSTVIPYENGGIARGQQIIDSDPNHLASTWGGKTPFSGTDGLNTHFIGHHWGAFDCMIPLRVGDKITISDDNAKTYTYVVEKRVVVDTHAIDVKSGKNYYSEIVSTGGGERITVQTCTSETERVILFAYPA